MEEERVLRRLFDLDELELLQSHLGVGGEEPLPVPGDRGRHHQPQFVDEPGGDQGPGELVLPWIPMSPPGCCFRCRDVVVDR